MSDLMDRIIADLVEGAQRSEGFIRGGRARVEVSRENRGRESKLAGHSGIGAAFGGPVGAALGADKGQELEAAKGSFMGGLKGTGMGGLGGAGLGALVAALTGGKVAPAAMLGGGLGAGLGGYAGSISGAAGAGDAPPGLLERMKGGSLETRYVAGIKAAAATFQIKEAILPLIGSLLGGTALRAGAGALARGAGGKMLGGLAGKALPHMAGGIGGAATDMVGSMAGGAIGQKLMPQQRPPQMPQQPGM